MPIVAVSGGFSVIHYGHIRLIKEASKHGQVIVILNSDEWLKRKYGSVVVPYYQREEVMFNIKDVTSEVRGSDVLIRRIGT